MKVTHPLKENTRFTSIKMIECTSFIDNAFTKAADTSPIPVLNPSTGQQIGSVHSSSKEETFLAIASSKKAFQEWTKFTISKRILILIKFHALIVENQETLIDLICQEHGKTRTEALGEILKGNETLLYAISLPSITGNTAKVSSGVVCRDERLPHGVCLSIVPFNFPYMVPMWTLPICIAMGNTLILKPSEKVPLTMRFVMDLLKKSGLPDGVVNLVNGVRETVELLCDHPDVKCVTFVGTTAVAEQLHLRCRKMNKRVLCLGGAKNHLVAFNDCDIQMCSSDIVASFVGCAGQRCMAASALLLIGEQQNLLDEIVSKAGKFSPGQGNQEMGPVIDGLSKTKILKYISDSEEQGAKILLDGRKWSEEKKGFWVGPTVILHSKKSDKALHDEIFGPVLSVLRVKNKEEAIEIENMNPYGNAACIYTSNAHVADWFCERFSAGMLGVNIGVPVPREPFSFGGINKSKFGDYDITGDGGLEFFTWRKKVTTKWAKPAESDWMS